jgi:uncharacterized protein
MTDPYIPAWWLPGPHTMTLWGKFFRATADLPVHEEQWKTPDDDEVTLVRLPARPDAPRLLVLHGLEGSAESHYARGMLTEAHRRGWGADVLVFRTCDGRLNRVRRTYHSGETTDLDLVVRRIVEEFPGTPIGVAGVSLGGNVLLKWLGEPGARIPDTVRVAAAISTPYDLARSSDWISQGFIRLYERSFLRSLKKKAIAKLVDFPDIGSAARVRASQTLRQFDDAFTAPAHGFRDAADYYERSSSIRSLSSIRIPTLLLNARDDPFYPPEVLDDVARIAAGNAYLTLDFHARGGHVGFVEGRFPHRPRYYIDRRLGEFFNAHLIRDPGGRHMERDAFRNYDGSLKSDRMASQWT